MSNNKQSSVECLRRQLSRIVLFDNEMDKLSYVEAFEKAKAMYKEEKKQVLKDYFAWHNSKGFVSHKKEDIEEFINETFEGNNEKT